MFVTLVLLLCYSKRPNNTAFTMVTLRFKPLKDGQFSAYLDIYYKNLAGKPKREYEFLNMKVSRDYSIQGARVKEADRDTLELAKGIRDKRELELLDGQYGLRKSGPDLSTGFMAFMEREVKRKDTNRDYNGALLKQLKDYVRQELTFADINTDWCTKFKQYLLGRVKQNSARSYLQVFKLFLNMAVDQGLLIVNPMAKVTLPKMQDVQRTTLDLDELRLLINTPTTFGFHIREAFLFSCFTGLRLSDVRKLKWSDIRNGRLTLSPKKTPDKIAVLPLSEQALAFLATIPVNPDSELVYHKLTANRGTLAEYMRLWGKQAGLSQRLHFHAGRHTFATIGITHGIDLYTMKELMVHSKIEMTQVYGKIVDSKKANEIAKFPTL